MIDTILFDMDGILVDSEPAHAAATSDALCAFGLNPVSIENFDRFFFGRPDWAGFRDYLTFMGRDDVVLDEIVEAKAAAFARRFPSEVRPMPDGHETLRALATRGYQVAIVSGGRASEIKLVIARFDLAPFVALAVSGDDVPDGKPNPEPFLRAADQFGVPPAHCFVIEDSVAGVAAAKAAGMLCLAVDRLGHPERLAQADCVVDTLTVEAVEALAGQAS